MINTYYIVKINDKKFEVWSEDGEHDEKIYETISLQSAISYIKCMCNYQIVKLDDGNYEILVNEHKYIFPMCLTSLESAKKLVKFQQDSSVREDYFEVNIDGVVIGSGFCSCDDGIVDGK